MTNDPRRTHAAASRKNCVHSAAASSSMMERRGGADDAIHAATAPTERRDQDWAETLDRLRAFVAARVEDPELAADITQDVIVRSIASGALDRVDNPAAWLYRSARNAVIDHYRTRALTSRSTRPERWPDPDTDDNLPNDATRELARCLQPMLGQLHPPPATPSPAWTSRVRPTSRPPTSSVSPCPG